MYPVLSNASANDILIVYEAYALIDVSLVYTAVLYTLESAVNIADPLILELPFFMIVKTIGSLGFVEFGVLYDKNVIFAYNPAYLICENVVCVNVNNPVDEL